MYAATSMAAEAAVAKIPVVVAACCNAPSIVAVATGIAVEHIAVPVVAIAR